MVNKPPNMCYIGAMKIRELKELIELTQICNDPINLIGPHGIGKSVFVYRYAQTINNVQKKGPAFNGQKFFDGSKVRPVEPTDVWTGIPVVEIRLSEVTDGDLALPKVIDGKFVWNLDPRLEFATKNECVLFLDERNRARPAVKQAVFQMLDSRACFGHALHPKVRIFLAENPDNGEYQVQECDPAELSRTLNVEVDEKAWMDHIQHPALKEWVKQYDYAHSRNAFRFAHALMSNKELAVKYAGTFLGTKEAASFNEFFAKWEKDNQNATVEPQTVADWVALVKRADLTKERLKELYEKCPFDEIQEMIYDRLRKMDAFDPEFVKWIIAQRQKRWSKNPKK